MNKRCHRRRCSRNVVVAMPAFLHYFNQGSMLCRANRLLGLKPKKSSFILIRSLAERIGISATDQSKSLKWICDEIQTRFQKYGAFIQFTKAHVEKAVKLGWDAETARKDAQTSSRVSEASENARRSNLAMFRLPCRYPEGFWYDEGYAFWSLFASSRQGPPC